MSFNFADQIRQYRSWADFVAGELKDEMRIDPAHSHSWNQLRLQVIKLADEQCARNLRSGQVEVFADVAKILDEFKVYWVQQEDAILRAVDSADFSLVLTAQHREGFLCCLLELLIEDSVGDPAGRDLVRVYDRHRIRSTAYEIAHYLLNLRQRLKEKAPILDQPMLTHMIKVDSVLRMRPDRSVDFIVALREHLGTFRFQDFVFDEWGEALRNPDFREWLLAVWEKFLDCINMRKVAPFQWRCFKEFVDEALQKRAGGTSPALITAGTGFGKTEAFLLPILFYILVNLSRKHPRNYGCDAILLYPRVDLCNDQLERCLKYLHALDGAARGTEGFDRFFNNPLDRPFRVAVAHGRLKKAIQGSDQPFSVRCPICASSGLAGKIELRQAGAYDLKAICTQDETHQVEDFLTLELNTRTGPFSIAITTVDTLHRRLMDIHGTESLWRNKAILPRFLVFDEIHVYGGQQGSHVANLARRLKAYLKHLPPTTGETKRANPSPPIFIGASATVGNREALCSLFFGATSERAGSRLFYPDENEQIPFGREYIFLLKTPPHRQLILPNSPPRVVLEMSTLLQAMMAFWHGMYKTPEKYRMLTFVDSIDAVWRITKDIDDAERNKSLYEIRAPSGRAGFPASRSGGVFCPQREMNSCIAPPHQFYQPCPTYNQGECWWTMLSSLPSDFLRPMVAMANASGQRRGPPGNSATGIDNWDCLVTTSTLEVGFDHPQLIASVQYKAPPNPASFQQRKGRSGRSREDTPMTLVVLGNSPGDLFSFRNEDRYFRPSPAHLAIFVDPQNTYVRSQHAISAVYDYLSWRGITRNSPDIHKRCDIPTALHYLDQFEAREDLFRWFASVYEDDQLSENDCRALVASSIDNLRKAVVQLSATLTAKGIHTSLDLFRLTEIPSEWLFQVRHRVNNGDGGKLEKITLAVLEAADRHCKRKPDGAAFLHPSEYLSALPINNDGEAIDRGNTIPETFVPVPIGGNLNVILNKSGRTRVEEGSRIQMLSSFLPGGFKNRWDFNLWYGNWQPVPTKAGHANIADICRSGRSWGTLQNFLKGRQIPEVFISTGIDAAQASLVEPMEISVSTGQRHFVLDSAESRVKLEGGGVNGPTLRGEEGPSSEVQTVDLISPESGESKPIALNGNYHGVFESADFGSLSLMRLYFANVVTAYLNDGRTLGMTVRFWNSDAQVPVIPVARMTTQGLRLRGSLNVNNLAKLRAHLASAPVKMETEHFWRNVYRIMWRKLLLGTPSAGLSLPNSFACLSVLQALKFIEYRARAANYESVLDLTQAQAVELQSECGDLSAIVPTGLFVAGSAEASVVAHWDSFKSEVLAPAASSLETEIAESFAHTIGAAITRDIAARTNANIDMLEISSELDREGHLHRFLICVYDDLEGGSGTVLSYRQQSQGPLNLTEILTSHSACPTALVESEVIQILTDPRHDADSLYSLAQNSSAKSEAHFSTESALRLRRLLTSPAISAFYQGAAENYQYLCELLKRAPTSVEVAISLLERPNSDPRGQALVQQFAALRGGISELVPRTEEIVPLCIGSCPDCLGDSRLSFRQGDKPVPDRNLLLGASDQ
jgi:hypothetical protein